MISVKLIVSLLDMYVKEKVDECRLTENIF